MKNQTIQTWLNQAKLHLEKASIESAYLDATIMLEKVLNKPRSWLRSHADEKLSNQQLKDLNKLLSQRLNRIPLAYILGSKDFYGRQFIVTKDVLVPRPESEAMINLLSYIAKKEEINTIIDIGTGSGILAITTKLQFSDVHVTASEISSSALSVAKKNARKHKVNIRFHKSDLFESLPSMPKTRLYVVLANLPYVPDNLIVSDEVLNEPKEALFSGNDGMDHYRKFWNQIIELKNKPKYIITESLKTQHNLQIKYCKSAGYKLVKTDGLVQLFSY